ncbi:MAG: ABC transporter ATP-binding protein [Xenococcus sp. (in: cyanobacteria)]
MSNTVIKVENLGKKYVIGHQKQEKYTVLRDVIANGARAAIQKITNPKTISNNTREEFWALKDVSFEIKQGEKVGIIGRNGAGKSTLLKVLSRITEPTKGRIKIKGRVASLLEVGTGFHPELTGRENIFLNGAILGMSKVEIKKKFDEIVAFAEVEKFLDTPVKRYSSGMYVRLAFAVAAHLEPEILVVDEVLAVGDVQFQKKCLGKMQEVGKEGRTVIFVSHNMAAVESLCDRGILFQSGKVNFDGTSDEVIKKYLEQAYNTTQELSLDQRVDRSGTGKIRAHSLRFLNNNGEEVSSLQSGKNYYIEVGYLNKTGQPLNNVIVSLDFFDEKGIRLLLFRNNFTNSYICIDSEQGYILCNIDNLPLAKGQYRISIFISHGDRETLDYIQDAALVLVDGGDFFGTGNSGLPTHCKILAPAQWSTKQGSLNIVG